MSDWGRAEIGGLVGRMARELEGDLTPRGVPTTAQPCNTLASEQSILDRFAAELARPAWWARSAPRSSSTWS